MFKIYVVKKEKQVKKPCKCGKIKHDFSAKYCGNCGIKLEESR